MLLTHLYDSSEKGKRKNTVVASAPVTTLQTRLKTILIQDMFDAFIEKFRLRPMAVEAIRKMKNIVFDDKKIYQLAI